ncbi:MAG: hypothetical protein AB7H97_21165 [Pseudobdellovibrionaceae bacterium]
MAVRTLVLILSLALVQTVSAQSQDLKEGDQVLTPNFAGQVTEVINKGEVNEQVRVQSNEQITTSAIYSSGQVEKVGQKKLSARQRRLQRARQAEFNFTGISLPSIGFAVGIGGIGVSSYVGPGR